MKYIQTIFALIFLIFLSFTFDNSEAAYSPVTISLESPDESPVRIIEANYAIFEITLENSDVTYRWTEVKLIANFPSGVSWTTMFLDVDYNYIPDDTVAIGKADIETVKLAVFCDGNCSAGDTNLVQVYAQTDPRFYPSDYGEGEDPGNHTDTCGSSDCVNDTTPASMSMNVTNTISISIKAIHDYSFDLAFDYSSMHKSSEYHFSWNYSIINTGYFNDSYHFGIELFDNMAGNNYNSSLSFFNPNSKNATNGTIQPLSYLNYTISFEHSYLPSFGEGYYLIFTVYSAGDPDTYSKSVRVNFTTVNMDPIANAGEDISLYAGEKAQFNGTGSDNYGVVVKYEWDFYGYGDYAWSSTDDGITSFTYENPGVYYASLRVTDDNNISATDSIKIVVYDDTTIENTDSEQTSSISFTFAIVSLFLLVSARRRSSS